MSSKLHLDVCHYEQVVAPSVDAYEVKADMVCLQVKLCDSYLSTLEVVPRLGTVQMHTFTFTY